MKTLTFLYIVTILSIIKVEIAMEITHLDARLILLNIVLTNMMLLSPILRKEYSILDRYVAKWCSRFRSARLIY